MTDQRPRYAVVRSGGVPPNTWESLGSAIFSEPRSALAFAAELDQAQVYELVPLLAPDEAVARG